MLDMSKIWIGTAGWHYLDWMGIVYPPRKAKSFSELSFLADFLDLVEVNSTFYRIPEAPTAKKWIDQAQHNPRFQFIIKLWQGFTHEERKIDPIEMTRFKALLAPLQDKARLATVLVQFPWSFKNSTENTSFLERLLDALAPYKCHVEFRHASWHDREILDRMSDREAGWVNIDQPVIGSSMGPKQELTSCYGYFRFHGRNYDNWFREGAERNQRYDYLYRASELDEWVPRIEEVAPKAEKSFVIFNNHFRGQALVNSLQMLAMLSDAPPDIPARLVAHYPELANLGPIVSSQGTLSLF
jgi:uncharacterized protein YecE (DUF72 family)